MDKWKIYYVGFWTIVAAVAIGTDKPTLVFFGHSLMLALVFLMILEIYQEVYFWNYLEELRKEK